MDEETCLRTVCSLEQHETIHSLQNGGPPLRAGHVHAISNFKIFHLAFCANNTWELFLSPGKDMTAGMDPLPVLRGHGANGPGTCPCPTINYQGMW